MPSVLAVHYEFHLLTSEQIDETLAGKSWSTKLALPLTDLWKSREALSAVKNMPATSYFSLGCFVRVGGINGLDSIIVL